MKEKPTSFTKAILFCFIIALSSCEKDLYEDSIHQHTESSYKGNIKITEKSFDELLLDKKFKNAYEKVSNTKAKNSFSKTIMEEKYNFIILNLPAKVIQKGNNISYTFQIARDTINVKYFENLIVGVDSLNQTKAYIAKYEINNDVKSLKNKIPFKSVTYHPIIYNKSPTAKITECITITYSLCNGVPYDCGGSICGFGELTMCSGSGGESNNGSGTTWGGSYSSGSGTTTTPLYSGGGSGTITYTNARKFFLSFSSIGIERELLTAMSSEASDLLSSYLNSNPYPSTNSTAAKTFITSLSQHGDWFPSQSVATQTGIFNYLIPNNFSLNSREFVSWTINYMTNNPNVTWAQFQNWFMGTSEGQDGDYDAAYWENPNLTFQKQNLPTLLNFKNACPSKYSNAGVVCNEIGGNVLAMYNAVIAQNRKLNTCAIRMSRALNYSGVVIPSLPDNPNGTKNSVIGADGKNYIINAKALNTWMKKTFGTNPSNYLHYTAAQGGTKGENFPNLLVNVKGIYSMITLPSIQSTWGTGHADLLENGECLLNCHFYDTNNNFVPVNYIEIWILN